MRRFAFAALLLAACHPQANQPTYEGADYSTLSQKVAHGERLTYILDCHGCHADDLQGHDMSDDPAKQGPIYSPNITLLVGNYSDGGLERLIRHGEPKDRRTFWFMPVESYQFLSDRDLDAIIAYLRTLKPQGKPQPPFKFNNFEQQDVDAGILGNAQIQIRKYRERQPIDLGPKYAWGRYLVQTTCTACHNNALQGWPNFTPNLDIAGAYSKRELTRLLTNGEGKTGKDVGPMSGVARAYFSHLTPSERAAIVDYVLARAQRPQ
jgi:mono/diheme cytochrome c family protein